MSPRDTVIGAAAAVAALPGWTATADRDAIARSYRFADFAHAFGWMTQVALAAEKLDHHPEWRNVYAVVEVVLTTHSAGGVTERDLTLARLMDTAAAEVMAR